MQTCLAPLWNYLSKLQLKKRISQRIMNPPHRFFRGVESVCSPRWRGAARMRRGSVRHFAEQRTAFCTRVLPNSHVAFDALTGTLLLLVSEETTANWQLVSMRRNASRWLSVTRLPIAKFSSMAVCYSHVLIRSKEGREVGTLHVYKVSADNSVRYAFNVSVGEHKWWGLACTRIDGDTYVAFSHPADTPQHSQVTLQRNVSPSQTPSRYLLANNRPHWLVFHEDTCCLSLFGTMALARTPSCRSTARSVRREYCSPLPLPLKTLFKWTAWLSLAIDSFFGIYIENPIRLLHRIVMCDRAALKEMHPYYKT